MDEVGATALYVTETIAGTARQFKKLTRRERAEVKRRLLAERKAKLEGNLKTGGIAAEAIFAELEAFDEDPPTEKLWLQFVNSDDGRGEIFAMSLTSYGADAQAIIDDIPGEMEITLVCKITGLQPVKPSETTNPNPQMPGPETVYGKGTTEAPASPTLPVT